MSQWLKGVIAAEDASWRPDYAMMSAFNWINALEYEIEQGHGQTVAAQKSSCMVAIGPHVATTSVTGREADVFEPMFHALCFALFLRTGSREGYD